MNGEHAGSEGDRRKLGFTASGVELFDRLFQLPPIFHVIHPHRIVVGFRLRVVEDHNHVRSEAKDRVSGRELPNPACHDRHSGLQKPQQFLPAIMSAPDHGLCQTPAGDGWFKTTHWSVVLNAGQRDSPNGSAALARLCQTYWYPVYTFVRRLEHGPEDAQDLTQEFFFRLIEKDYLKALDRETGKFRSFLLVVLKRFLANEWDRANRQKRGGGRQIVSLNAEDTELRYRNEPVDDRTPEKVFDQRWALAVLEQVMNRLQTEMIEAGKAELFGGLKAFLGGEGDGASYSEVAVRLQMNEGALRVAVHRLRRRYREILREEIASTVASPDQIEDEIRHLFLSLG